MQLVLDVVSHRGGETDAARLRERLQTGCDIDAVAIEVAGFDDYVTQVDPYAELDPLLRRYTGIACDHAPLDIEGATHCLDNTGKLDQHTVTCEFHNPAAVLGDGAVDQLAPMPLEAHERALLVSTHEAGIASDISHKNCSQSTLNHLPVAGTRCHPTGSIVQDIESHILSRSACLLRRTDGVKHLDREASQSVFFTFSPAPD